MLEVVEPGVLLTIQDAGRPGLGHLGVPPSGACDPWGRATACLLAEAPPGGAALEVTIGGTVLQALESCAVALAGADLGAELDDGRPLRPEVVHLVPAGSRIRFGGGRGPAATPGGLGLPAAPGAPMIRGARAYLALAGGIAGEQTLGSRSSYRRGGLGPWGGRPLAAGDRIAPVRRGDLGGIGLAWPVDLAPHPATSGGPLGIVPGPDEGSLPPGALAAIAGESWRVDVASDRMGIRLAGTPLAGGAEIVSHPLLPGAVQVPPDGRPIVLLADGPTVGGYPVIGVVPRADLPRLGQLSPGDEVAFVAISADDARARWRDQQERLVSAAAALGADALWHRLADHAGG
jgi:biotin-dependent carboxylase-like uncharacterized protein